MTAGRIVRLVHAASMFLGAYAIITGVLCLVNLIPSAFSSSGFVPGAAVSVLSPSVVTVLLVLVLVGVVFGALFVSDVLLYAGSGVWRRLLAGTVAAPFAFLISVFVSTFLLSFHVMDWIFVGLGAGAVAALAVRAVLEGDRRSAFAALVTGALAVAVIVGIRQEAAIAAHSGDEAVWFVETVGPYFCATAGVVMAAVLSALWHRDDARSRTQVPESTD